MSNVRYIIKFKSVNATAVLVYNKKGYLVSFELEPGEFKKEQYHYFFARFPKTHDQLLKWKKAKIKTIRVKVLPPDISFKTFYDKYNHKVSKRKVAEKIWQGMEDMERIKAIDYIPTYENHLKMTNINKKYPETYLRSDMWNN